MPNQDHVAQQDRVAAGIVKTQPYELTEEGVRIWSAKGPMRLTKAERWERFHREYGATNEQKQKVDYREYIQSPEWRIKATGCKERYGNRCAVCNAKGGLDAHHRTYERLGDEDPSDLIALCRECHDSFHGRMAKRGKG